MISKEELKEMYYYVGPYYYKHKLVRVFRTKTDLSCVFYYDTNGELSLMGVRETNDLAKMLSFDDTIIYDLNEKLQSGNNETSEDFFDVNWLNELLNLFPEENTKINRKVYSLKKNSFLAEVVPSNDPNLIIFKIRDTSLTTPTNCVFTFRNEAKKPERGALEESDILTVLDNLEKYKEICSSQHITNILNRLNGYEVILQDEEVFSVKHTAQAMGGCLLKEPKILLNVDKTNNNATFEHVIKHELFHAMSKQVYKNGDIETCVTGIDGDGKMHTINEFMTEYLAGKVDGKYVGYPELMPLFENLFGNNIPTEALQSYFDNNQERFYKSVSEYLCLDPIEIQKFSLCLDHMLHIYGSKDLTNEEKKKSVAEQLGLLNNTILKSKIKQNMRSGDVSPEAFDNAVSTLGLTNEKTINLLREYVFSVVDKQDVDLITDRLTIALQSLPYLPSKYSNYENKNEIFEENFKTVLKTYDEGYVMFLDAMTNEIDGKFDLDYAHFYAMTTNAVELINGIDNIEKLFDERSLATVQQKLLKDNFENKEEILSSLYENHREMYKGIIKNALIYGSEAYVDKSTSRIIGKLYTKLTSEERDEIVTELCNYGLQEHARTGNCKAFNQKVFIECYNYLINMRENYSEEDVTQYRFCVSEESRQLLKQTLGYMLNKSTTQNQVDRQLN